jgi:hypothetical protein
MITLGLLEAGQREAAIEAMQKLGAPLGWDARTTAENVLQQMAGTLAEAARAFLFEINSKPVYTIYEVLQERKIQPASLVIIGGPALQIGPYVSKALALPYRIPKHFDIANAVGAAVARVTSEITLHADTARGIMVIPEAAVHQSVKKDFTMDRAISLARHTLKRRALEIGAKPEALEFSITEKQVFNMIRGFSRTGQNLRLKMCLVPGLIDAWKKGR